MRGMLLVVMVLGAAGCGAMGAKPHDDLIFDVRSFQEALRWRKYDDAVTHLPATRREKFLDAHQKLDKELRIDDYELERINLKTGEKEARVQVRYTWHLDGVNVVRETVLEQTWKKEGKVWKISSAKHKHGDSMPDITTLPDV